MKFYYVISFFFFQYFFIHLSIKLGDEDWAANFLLVLHLFHPPTQLPGFNLFWHFYYFTFLNVIAAFKKKKFKATLCMNCCVVCLFFYSSTFLIQINTCNIYVFYACWAFVLFLSMQSFHFVCMHVYAFCLYACIYCKLHFLITLICWLCYILAAYNSL